jgi:hypothetical protein
MYKGIEFRNINHSEMKSVGCDKNRHYHIITQHFATSDWLDIQTRHLKSFIVEPSRFTIWLLAYKLPPGYDKLINCSVKLVNLDLVKNLKNDHYIIMEQVYDFLRPNFRQNDVAIFLDSDAFPIAPFDPFLDFLFSYSDVASVYRYEDYKGDNGIFPCPHLCFTGFTIDTKDRFRFRFELGGYQCPGVTFRHSLESKKIPHAVISRTNIFEVNSVMFGVYGDVVYHNSCGSRAKVGRPYPTPGANPDPSRMVYEGVDFLKRAEIPEERVKELIKNVYTNVFDCVFAELEADKECKFVRQFFLGRL